MKNDELKEYKIKLTDKEVECLEDIDDSDGCIEGAVLNGIIYQIKTQKRRNENGKEKKIGKTRNDR